jgi:hypothetical protein
VYYNENPERNTLFVCRLVQVEFSADNFMTFTGKRGREVDDLIVKFFFFEVCFILRFMFICLFV